MRTVSLDSANVKPLNKKENGTNKMKNVVEILPNKVKDMGLAKLGRYQIGISEKEMPGLMSLREKYSNEKPLSGFRLVHRRGYEVPYSQTETIYRKINKIFYRMLTISPYRNSLRRSFAQRY